MIGQLLLQPSMVRPSCASAELADAIASATRAAASPPGTPGPSAGHAVQSKSYFDRFWEHGQHTGRHYFVLRRPT